MLDKEGTQHTYEQEVDEEGNPKETMVTDGNGNVWIVDKDGNVSQGGGSGSGGATEPDALPTDSVDFIVQFAPSEEQKFGFDAKSDDYQLSHYNQTQIQDEEYWIAWKSVETGNQDAVNARTGKEKFPDFVGFKTSTGEVASQSANTAGEQQILVTGKMAGETETLTAYVKVKEGEEESEVEVGKLNIATYNKVTQKVFIVPVNDASVTGNIGAELNKIYGQAVAEWEVTITEPFNIETSAIQGLDEGESGMLASFPKNMRQFNREFKRSRDIDKDAYYVFLVKGSGSDRKGFMPFKRQYGYIFTDRLGSTPMATAIAHELGHGAFRLRHPQSELGVVMTDNLMHSTNGTVLRKYQWDYVHDPESMVGWFQDDEESAMEGGGIDAHIAQKLTEFGSTLAGNFYAIKHCENCDSDLDASSQAFHYSDLTVSSEGNIALFGNSLHLHSAEVATSGGQSCVIIYVTTENGGVSIEAGLFQGGGSQINVPSLVLMDGEGKQFVCTNQLGDWSAVICQEGFGLTGSYIDNLLLHLNSCIDSDVIARTDIPSDELSKLQQLVTEFEQDQDIAAQVTIVDQADFASTVNSAEVSKDVHLVIGKSGGQYSYKFLYRDGLFDQPTSKTVASTGETISLEYQWSEVETIRDNHIDKSISNPGAIDELTKRPEPTLNIFERGMWVVKVTKETLAEIKVPEPMWNSEVETGSYPFQLESLTAGLGDGAVDELKSIPDLLILALSLFDEQERTALLQALQQLDYETVEKMFREKADKYAGGGDVAFHEAGYDGVQIGSMFWGGAFIKGAKKGSETASEVSNVVKRLADEILEKIDNPSIIEDLGKLSDKTRLATLKKLGDNPDLLSYLKDNPVLAKAWTQHKQVVDAADLDLAAELANKADDALKDKITSLITSSEKKQAFLDLMGKARKYQQDVFDKWESNFLRSAEEVSFDVVIDGKTFRTRLDGIGFDELTGTFKVIEAKMGGAVFSESQKMFMKALKEGKGEIIPVGQKATDVFRELEGTNVLNVLSKQVHLNDEIVDIATYTSRGL